MVSFCAIGTLQSIPIAELILAFGAVIDDRHAFQAIHAIFRWVQTHFAGITN